MKIKKSPQRIIYELSGHAEEEGKISQEEREAVMAFVAKALVLRRAFDDINKRDLV